MIVAGIYKGISGRQTAEENYAVVKFEVSAQFLPKALRAQAFLLGRNLRVRLRVQDDERVFTTTWKLQAVDVWEDHSSVWAFRTLKLSPVDLDWIPSAHQRVVYLRIRRSDEEQH